MQDYWTGQVIDVVILASAGVIRWTYIAGGVDSGFISFVFAEDVTSVHGECHPVRGV
jgi:hypothetical protein